LGLKPETAPSERSERLLPESNKNIYIKHI